MVKINETALAIQYFHHVTALFAWNAPNPWSHWHLKLVQMVPLLDKIKCIQVACLNCLLLRGISHQIIDVPCCCGLHTRVSRVRTKLPNSLIDSCREYTHTAAGWWGHESLDIINPPYCLFLLNVLLGQLCSLVLHGKLALSGNLSVLVDLILFQARPALQGSEWMGVQHGCISYFINKQPAARWEPCDPRYFTCGVANPLERYD